MKKASLVRFLAIYFFYSATVNFVHPVTPALFQQLHFPDYMFGVAFAAMAVASFAFSPFWGNLADRVGYIKVFCIGIAGYGVGQFFFMISTSVGVTLLARAFTGAFAAAAIVGGMSYVARLATDEQRGRYMASFAAITSVGQAAGYFGGGMLGTLFSIRFAFITQIICSFLVPLAALLLMREVKSPSSGEKLSIKKLNPVGSFLAMRHFMTMPLAVFLLTVALTAFGTTGFDNSFNYYIRDQLGFPTSYNGIIKAAVGLIGLAANFTINLYIAARVDGRKAIVPVLSICGGTLLLIPLVSQVPLFIAVAIVFFTFNAIYLPIQQTLVTRNAGKAGGAIFGAFNSVMTLGQVLGSLFAGFVYTVNSKLPFYWAAGAFVLGAALCMVNFYQFRRRESAQRPQISAPE